MYAQIFGIADAVAEQFKKLYPEIIIDMNNIGYDYTDIVFCSLLILLYVLVFFCIIVLDRRR